MTKKKTTTSTQQKTNKPTSSSKKTNKWPQPDWQKKAEKEFDKLAKTEHGQKKERKKSKSTTATTPAKPFRDLEEHGVTYSFLAKFLGCREQARLQYVEGLTKDGCIDALDFGSMYHELLEHFSEGSDCRLPALKKRLDGWLTKQRQYRRMTSEACSNLMRLADIALTMFPLYLSHWKKQNGHEYRSDFVCQEEDFNVEHPIPWSNGQRSVILRGRFDAIFRMKGKLWLMENKTKSMIDEEGLTASLSLDLQTMLYSRAIELKYGEKPEGVLYNVIRRPALRQGKTEKYNDYLERIRVDVANNLDWYFPRWTVNLQKSDIDKWVVQTLNPLLTQVCLWWDEIKKDPFHPFDNPNRTHHFVNPEALYSRYGRSDFFELLTRNSFAGLIRRSG